MLYEAIIAFVGLVIGLLIAHFTKDELKSGKKYFDILERVLLIVLIILLLYQTWNSFVFLIIGFVAGFMMFIGVSRIYLYLGLALFLAFLANTTFVQYFVGLIFVLGLVYGAQEYKKLKFEFIVLNAILFAAPFLLLFVEPFVADYSFIFYPFVAGAFFAKFLLRK